MSVGVVEINTGDAGYIRRESIEAVTVDLASTTSPRSPLAMGWPWGGATRTAAGWVGPRLVVVVKVFGRRGRRHNGSNDDHNASPETRSLQLLNTEPNE